jgi:hypothetical protein
MLMYALNKGKIYYKGMGQQSKIIKCLVFFFLTIKSLGTLNSTVKSIGQILLTSVTLFETHRFLPIKILIFNFILKMKSIKKQKKKNRKQGWPNHPIGSGWPPLRPWGWFGHPQTGWFFLKISTIKEI